ncbi:MAG: methyltransferase domain-containing protein [Pseudomonadota bacterium]
MQRSVCQNRLESTRISGRSDSRDYWEDIFHSCQQDTSNQLWRDHSDAVNLLLLSQWLPREKVDRLLKTDLFDELYGVGLLPDLQRYARKVFGIDLSYAATFSGREGSAVTLTADTRSLPFADGSFDIIVSPSTLDHFETTDEIRVSLEEFHRVLKSGGQLILTMDNPGNPAIALRNRMPHRLLKLAGIVQYKAGRTLTKEQILSLLSAMGFEVDDMMTIMHCPRAIAVALSRIIQNHAPALSRERFLVRMMGFERIASWPTRFFTGYFIAVRAFKRPC